MIIFTVLSTYRHEKDAVLIFENWEIDRKASP